MTNEEAEKMLAELTEHYHQPVLPLRRVCQAISQWMDAIVTDCARPDKQFGPYDLKDSRHGAAYADHLLYIRTDIQKSALLFRLLYRGEKIRTVRCPEHHGVLSMQEWIGNPSHQPCPHGCGGTGWLPEGTTVETS